MGGIFISYRRSDVAGHALALYEKLAHRFGAAQLFMDIDSIEPGSNFVNVIEQALRSSSVVLVLMGRHWYQPERLQEPQDFVRLEIAMALDRRMLVIPVLLEGAAMPKAESLPDSICALAWLQAEEISHRRFGSDVGHLADFLARFVDSGGVPPPPQGPEPPPPEAVRETAGAKARDSEPNLAPIIVLPGPPYELDVAPDEEQVPEIELGSIPKDWARRRAWRKTTKFWLGVPGIGLFIVALIVGINTDSGRDALGNLVAGVLCVLFPLLLFALVIYVSQREKSENGSAAAAALKAERLAEAEDALKWLISYGQQARHAWAYGMLGTLYSQQGRYALAEEAFRRSESLAPMQEWIRKNREINAGLASASA